MECILVSDTGSGESEQYKVAKSIEKLLKKNKKIKCVIATGDNIYEDGCTSVNDEQFNTKFQDPYKNIDLPFYLCLGNHDYNLGLNAAKVQIDYTFSELNKNKKWNMPNKWYTLSYPTVDLVFIDTNFYWLSQSVIQKQLNDTIKSLNKNKNKWKILCGHHTWRSVGGHGSAEDQHESFMNSLLKKAKFHLYVCGHDHCKSIIELKEKNIHTLVIGTGGKSYSEEMFYPDKLSENELLHFYSPNLGMCHMKSTKNNLTLKCYNDKLDLEYSYKITK